MSRKHLKLDPYNLHEHAWLYEEMKGLLLVVETRSGKTEQLLIPVGNIRQYLVRRDTPTKTDKQTEVYVGLDDNGYETEKPTHYVGPITTTKTE